MPKDMTVANLTITENGDCAGGFAAGGFLNKVDPVSGISWIAGTVDPRGQFEASAGSLYSRRVGTVGELWMQAGPTTNDWVKIA